MKFMVSLVLLGLAVSGCASLSQPAPRTTPHEVVSARQAKAENVLKSLPEMTVRDYEVLGDLHVQQGNPSLAFLQYDKALRLEPNHLSLRYKQSRLLLQNGSIDAAVRSFQDMLKLDPNSALAHEGLGEAFLRAHKLDQAERSCSQAVALDSARWRSYNCLGMTYDRKKQFQDAIAAYQQAIKLQPG